jgi:starch phosphorylase
VDLWLNNPQKPLEASGTSGMKAAMNGVPSLSVLDGWWIEGHAEGVTGWAIGDESPDGEETEIASLYDKLEYAIMPMFYKEPLAFAAVMRHCIALNGEFFSAQRMMNQYNQDVYHAPGEGF